MIYPTPSPPDDELSVLLLSIVVLLWLAFMPLQCAQAQPTGTWTTHFDEKGVTVWLVIRPPFLVVVNQDSRGQCMAVPAKVRWDGLTPIGRDWAVKRQADTLSVTFPPTRGAEADTTVHYHRTTEDPVSLCQTTRET